MAQDPNVDRTRHLDPFLRISTFSKSPQRQRLAA
jgi:hypothetical protein